MAPTTTTGSSLWKNASDNSGGVYGFCQMLATGVSNLPFSVDGTWADHNASTSMPSGFNIIAGRYDGETVSHWLNSATNGSQTIEGEIDVSTGDLQVGGYAQGNWTENFNGDVCEVLLFNRALTNQEVAGVNTYLANKWGISSSSSSSGSTSSTSESSNSSSSSTSHSSGSQSSSSSSTPPSSSSSGSSGSTSSSSSVSSSSLSRSSSSISSSSRSSSSSSSASGPELKLWFDASDASTLFKDAAMTQPVTADGDLIGAWKDKAGGNHHVTASGSARPTFKIDTVSGKPVVHFDGVANLLTGMVTGLGRNTSKTICMTVRFGGNSQTAFHLGGTGSLEGFGLSKNADGNAEGWQGGNGNSCVDDTMPTTFTVVRLVKDENDLSLYIDGELVAGPVTCDEADITNNTFGLGALNNAIGGFLYGDICEVCVWNTGLEDDQQAFIQDYLTRKWLSESSSSSSSSSGSSSSSSSSSNSSISSSSLSLSSSSISSVSSGSSSLSSTSESSNPPHSSIWSSHYSSSTSTTSSSISSQTSSGSSGTSSESSESGSSDESSSSSSSESSSITIKEIWSDQYPDIKANLHPGSTGGADRDYIMVGFRKDTTTGKWVGAVKTQLEISPDNEETRAKVSVQLGVVTGDNITLVGSAQRVDAESIAALSQSTEESEFFRVIAWFDDQPDKKTKSDGRIRFVSLRAYLRAINSLQAGFVDYITAAGGRFLAGFIRDTGLLHATVTEDSVIPNEATHNTGVLWESVDESYTAPVRLNTFGAESYVANAIRQHSDFKGRVSATLSAYEPEVLDWEWDSAEHTFGPWSMPGLIEFNAFGP